MRAAYRSVKRRKRYVQKECPQSAWAVGISGRLLECGGDVLTDNLVRWLGCTAPW